MATLRSYILGKRKTIPRGAASRVMKYLGVTHAKAVALIAGVREPDSEWMAMEIQNFISSRAPFSAKKPGPKAKFSKKV